MRVCTAIFNKIRIKVVDILKSLQHFSSNTGMRCLWCNREKVVLKVLFREISLFSKKSYKIWTVNMSNTSKSEDKLCTLCQRIGLRPFTKQNILYYYAPLNGMVSTEFLLIKIKRQKLFTWVTYLSKFGCCLRAWVTKHRKLKFFTPRPFDLILWCNFSSS